ncbi:HNH endonuclease family protein [Streptomyces sp. NPDC001675]
MRLARTTAAAAVFAALFIASPAHANAASRTPGQMITAPVQELPAQLEVTSEDRTGYDRRKFKHWIDADKDGCNTRAEVLKAESVIAPEQATKCTLLGGEWYSPYDNRYIDEARGLDIDHLVPLAEAWDSGASAWSAAEREAYANDLGDDRALIAVSAASNRSKADQDPSTWLPPAVGYRCQYATDWIADKTRWGLSIDTTEHAALGEELGRCPNVPITVTTAR